MNPDLQRTFDRLVALRDRLERERSEDPTRPVIVQLEKAFGERRQGLASDLGIAPEELDDYLERGRFDEELVPADDAIIGRAFRYSLLAFGAIALVVLLVLFVLRRPGEEAAEQAIETAAPVQIDEAPLAEAPEVSFRDVTAVAGITHEHFNGAYGDKLLPETMGGGGAFVDLDGDGDSDLIFVNGTDWPHRRRPRVSGVIAYRNEGDGEFSDATTALGLDDPFYGQGVAVGDFDNDGRRDLFFTAVGGNRLYRNLGGRFEEVTSSAGVGGDDDVWSTCAAFIDIDNDGDLDLYVGNYVLWSKEIDFEVDYRLTGLGRAYGPPANYQGTYAYLYRNRGDGTFEDVSATAGVQVDNPVTGAPSAKTLGVSPVDVDRDGFIDLLIANDTVGNFYFRNRGDGTFSEEGGAAGVAYDRVGSATGAMGVDAGFYRNDDDLGFAIGNFANEMTSLYVSQGDPGLFADEAIGEGIGAVSRTALTFGLFLFDYDLDGRLDLLQTNGHLEEEINSVDPSQTYRQAAQLFWNAGPDQRQTFLPVPAEALGELARPIVGRGSAYGDLEGDGDLDVVLFQVGGAPLLVRNDQQLGHHFLRLSLVGDPAAGVNRDAIGAWVELTAGGVLQRRQVMPTKSYLSQSELTLTFGLGDAERVDSLTVLWPGGERQELGAIEAVDRLLVVNQNSAAD
ncbi:MAG: CRTAC1 family protein [Acidobacteriota bacterium]